MVEDGRSAMESQKTTPRVPIRDLVLYYLKVTRK